MSNPLFDVYGKIVDQLFAPNSREGDPVMVYIDAGNSMPKDRGEDPDELDYETIAHHLSAAKLQEIQTAVDTLRRFLQQEKGGSKSGPMTQKLGEFRSVLQFGDESKLAHNPFYAIVKAVYRLNLDAASGLFQFMHSQSSLHPPKAVPFVPTLVEIWGRGNQKADFLSKVSATLDKWLNSGKLPIEIFVFFGSTYTSARGVSDLLQIPGALPFMTEGFGSSEAEFQRTLIAYLCGLILSCGILDYKGRLFRCIAEAESFFRGIGHAFKRNPRWMILATLLTVISIKTNYDGIVSLVSKKADLDEQSYQIKEKVRKALGNRKDAKTANPSNLYDLQLILQEAAGVATQNFLQIPKDEAGGGASSGNVGQGPRYWGKFYVTMGGYEPGVADISLAVSGSSMAQTLDKVMRDSGLDLKSSIPDKINALRSEYENHLKTTNDLADFKLAKLDELMSMQDYSWSELSRVFNLEHYKINEIVADVTKALEENTVQFKRTASQMNALTDAHVELLKTLDRTGIVGESNYQIDAKVSIPNIDAIDELKKNKIPAATHKSFEELKVFLNDAYGVALASSLLLVIFLIAISMDMANPMLYSRLTAIQGKKDRKAYRERSKKLKEWENDFAARCKAFFDREDVEKILFGMTFPNDTTIRNTFSLMLEEVDPWVKDYVHYTFKEKSITWFKSLFETTRIIDIEGYNSRARAVHFLLAQRERFFANFINRLFPGVMDQEFLETGTFAELIGSVEEESVAARERLAQEMKMTLQAANRLSMDARIREWRKSRWVEQPEVMVVENKVAKSSRLGGLFKKSPKKSSLDRWTAELEDAQREEEALVMQRADELALQKSMTKSVSEEVEKSEEEVLESAQDEDAPITMMRVFWYVVWHKAFMEPVAHFGYTRLAWLREIEARNRQFGEGLETLYDFIPTLKITLGETLPRIQDDTFEPLMDIWNRFPAHCLASGLEGVEEMEQKFMEMEKSTLEIWGVSQFLGPDLDEQVLAAVTNKDEIDKMAWAITGDGSGESMFEEKLKALDEAMQAALKRAKAVEADAIAKMRGVFESVATSRNEINQTLLKINLRGLEMRNLPLSSQSQLRSLAQTRSVIEDAPRLASSILARIEAFLDGKTSFDERKFEELWVLEKESREILENVRQVMRSLDRPMHLDPRLAEEWTAQDAASGAALATVAGSGKWEPKRDRKIHLVSEQQERESRVMFTTHGGSHCEGMTRDVSATGLKMATSHPVQGIASDEEGILRLVLDGGIESFPCRVVQAGGRELRLQFLANQEKFLALVRPELLAELAREVAPSFSLVSQPILEELESEAGSPWTAALAKQHARSPRQPSASTAILQPVEKNVALPFSAASGSDLDGPQVLVEEEIASLIQVESLAQKPRLLPWGANHNRVALVESSVESGLSDTDFLIGESASSVIRLLDWGAHTASVPSMATGGSTVGSGQSLDSAFVSLPVAQGVGLVGEQNPWGKPVEGDGGGLMVESDQEPFSYAQLSLSSASDMRVLSAAQRVGGSERLRLPMSMDVVPMRRDMQQRLDEAEQVLMRINLHLIELRREGSPDAGLLQTMEACGQMLAQAPDEIDDILLGLLELPEGDFDVASLEYRELMTLHATTTDLLKRIDEFQVALGMSPQALPPIAKPMVRQTVKPQKATEKKSVKPLAPVFLPSAVSRLEPQGGIQLQEAKPATAIEAGPETLFQTLRDENVQLRRDLRPFQATFARLRVPVVLTSLLIGFFHVLFV